MCGIVAYVGKGHCKDFILEGLTRLEYRGYDSAGFACINSEHKRFSYVKTVGLVSALKESVNKALIDGHVGIGHTRWATHGIANQENAHPHFNCSKSVSIVHNGIIESHEELREKLINSGHDFYSTTDTEVIAHLFGSLLKIHHTLKNAVLDLVSQAAGAYALALLMEDYPDQLIAVRRRSPLVIGIGEGENFIASDVLAFWDKTNKVFFIPDNSFAIINKDSVQCYDFAGNSVPIKIQDVDFKFANTDKQGFEHYMLKEIYEQKKAIDNTISFCRFIGSKDVCLKHIFDPNNKRKECKSNIDSIEYSEEIWQQLGLEIEQLKNLKQINLIAAGTSWHACRIIQFFIETICKIPVHVFLSSEFRYMPFFPKVDTVFIFISQSGETADTLEALRLVNSYNLPTIVVTNVVSSTMVREAGGFLPMQAGPEISVASTKAFSCQISILYWLAHRIALFRGLISLDQMRVAEDDLLVTAEVLESSIETYKWEISQTLAKFYAKFERFIFLGRHISYPFAMEAALKLKEISYIFAQCYPAGELKHGPIALIDKRTPIIMFSVLDDLIYQKLVANAQEVKARNGHLVSFAFEGQNELIKLSDCSFIIPRVKPLLAPLAMTGLMQFFIYQITKELGRPIDKPRNLAKSVTVE
ncbi:glutamine--fructose-6-phosphate transaminase (isomerizing) [Candidatus Babeliales bacterium]|nr:glutamine--fructose-6-phosphate transaminase (isomerizing) [Candidatus Babeliales bacterium]MCF7899476.1 glutamine--fructose-6-phosphate transaminase (isomerizing) [Candidatus Babeliales bacterium]